MSHPIIIPVSGGIDSAYLLARALKDGHVVHAVQFDDDDMFHSESYAAHQIISHYDAIYNSIYVGPQSKLVEVKLRIPQLDLLKVQYDVHPEGSQAQAMQDIDYWSGFKALFYATALAYGGAIGASQIQWGVYEWNDHFEDEKPERAHEFRNAWERLYPDLHIPVMEFPLWGRTKSSVLIDAHEIGVPLELTYSCFRDNGPCGECLGCTHRAAEFREAQMTDPALGQR